MGQFLRALPEGNSLSPFPLDKIYAKMEVNRSPVASPSPTGEITRPLILTKGWLKFSRWAVAVLVGFVLLMLLLIPVRLSIAAHQAPRPQAILVLGGDSRREEAAAQLAQHYPDLEVWVSTGEVRQKSEAIFRAAGIANNRVHLDYRAVDTVTNFTTLVADFKQRDIQHVFVVTSDFHMTRARAIATIVLGSQGIAFTPVSVQSDRLQEAPIRVWRDIGRSVMWIFTGRTGSSIGERLKEERYSRLKR